MIKVERFNKNKSILKNVYIKFLVNDPSELKKVYMNEDQKLMRNGKWDYENPELITNKIKDSVEAIGVQNISDKKEKIWISDILWMWYHHATSCALYRYGNKKEAIKYSTIALDLQTEDHPNKITRLLYFLSRDNLNNAERWFKLITEEPEKTTAKYLIDRYKQGNFFKAQINKVD